MKKAGFIRKTVAVGLDLGMSAGAGFLLMWPLGTFEGQEAYEFNQIMQRILFLIVASFLILNAWMLIKNRNTLGRRIMNIGGNPDGTDKPLGFFNATLRTIMIVLLSLTPPLYLFAGGIIVRIVTRLMSDSPGS